MTPEVYDCRLTRRGVGYIVSKSLPQIVIIEVMMQCKISASDYVERSRLNGFGVEMTSEISCEFISNGAMSKLPSKIALELIG